MDLSSCSDLRLLRLYSEILETLKARGTTRTNNAPVAGYAEHLFCKAFDWSLEANSKAGYDAISRNGERFQIMSRRLTPDNGSRQLGAIRRLYENPFDYVAAVLFDQDFSINRAALIPVQTVQSLAKKNSHTNSYRFLLRDSVWNIEQVDDVTTDLQHVQRN